MSMSPDNRMLELTEFVKLVKEQQMRQASTQQALARARERAAMREQFRPVCPAPMKPVKLRF
jgi:hypothetical protein